MRQRKKIHFMYLLSRFTSLSIVEQSSTWFDVAKIFNVINCVIFETATMSEFKSVRSVSDVMFCIENNGSKFDNECANIRVSFNDVIFKVGTILMHLSITQSLSASLRSLVIRGNHVSSAISENPAPRKSMYCKFLR